jgi:hypothetical protein
VDGFPVHAVIRAINYGAFVPMSIERVDGEPSTLP